MTRRRGARALCNAFLLFTIVSVVFLGLVRLAHALARGVIVDEPGLLPGLLVEGLRVDLALVGLLLLPAILVSALALWRERTRELAHSFVTVWLGAAFAFAVLAEAAFAITVGFAPWSDNSRPASVDHLAVALEAVLTEHPVPASLVAAIAALVIVGFTRRLRATGLLRYRLPPIAGALGLLLAASLASVAAMSGLEPPTDPAGGCRASIDDDRGGELATNGLCRVIVAWFGS